jgi:hypothetical protein
MRVTWEEADFAGGQHGQPRAFGTVVSRGPKTEHYLGVRGVTPSGPGSCPSDGAASSGVSTVPASIPNADPLVARIALSLAVECECDPSRAANYRLEAEAVVADLWQPNETAPIDGTRVIAWWPHLGEAVVAWISQGGRRRGSWTFSGLPSVKIAPVTPPALWMPLPGPPNV